MNSRYLVFLACLAMVFVEYEAADILPCLQKNWVSCGITLGSLAFQIHQWKGSDFMICNYRCRVEIKGRIHRFQWVWDGRVNCAGLGNGEARGLRSTKGAAENSLKNMFAKLNPEKLQEVSKCIS